jgi:hypothetical protein
LALAIHIRQYIGGGMGQVLRTSLGNQGAGIGSGGAGLVVKLGHGLAGEVMGWQMPPQLIG